MMRKSIIVFLNLIAVPEVSGGVLSGVANVHDAAKTGRTLEETVGATAVAVDADARKGGGKGGEEEKKSSSNVGSKTDKWGNSKEEYAMKDGATYESKPEYGKAATVEGAAKGEKKGEEGAEKGEGKGEKPTEGEEGSKGEGKGEKPAEGEEGSKGEGKGEKPAEGEERSKGEGKGELPVEEEWRLLDEKPTKEEMEAKKNAWLAMTPAEQDAYKAEVEAKRAALKAEWSGKSEAEKTQIKEDKKAEMEAKHEEMKEKKDSMTEEEKEAEKEAKKAEMEKKKEEFENMSEEKKEALKAFDELMGGGMKDGEEGSKGKGKGDDKERSESGERPVEEPTADAASFGNSAKDEVAAGEKAIVRKQPVPADGSAAGEPATVVEVTEVEMGTTVSMYVPEGTTEKSLNEDKAFVGAIEKGIAETLETSEEFVNVIGVTLGLRRNRRLGRTERKLQSLKDLDVDYIVETAIEDTEKVMGDMVNWLDTNTMQLQANINSAIVDDKDVDRNYVVSDVKKTEGKKAVRKEKRVRENANSSNAGTTSSDSPRTFAPVASTSRVSAEQNTGDRNGQFMERGGAAQNMPIVAFLALLGSLVLGA